MKILKFLDTIESWLNRKVNGPNAEAPPRVRITNELRQRSLEFMQQPALWPMRPILPLVNEQKDLAFILEDFPERVYHGLYLMVSEDVLQSAMGNLNGAVFEAWSRNQRFDTFNSYEDIIAAGWVVD